jgi:hypothetical protein
VEEALVNLPGASLLFPLGSFVCSSKSFASAARRRNLEAAKRLLSKRIARQKAARRRPN